MSNSTTLTALIFRVDCVTGELLLGCEPELKAALLADAWVGAVHSDVYVIDPDATYTLVQISSGLYPDCLAKYAVGSHLDLCGIYDLVGTIPYTEQPDPWREARDAEDALLDAYTEGPARLAEYRQVPASPWPRHCCGRG